MLKIEVPGGEYYDERINRFIEYKPQTLQLEHSLISISKWESKWCKAFLSKNDKTNEEILSYVECMTLVPPSDPSVYLRLTKSNVDAITSYIDAPMTATHVREIANRTSSREIVTSELIYYWIFSYGIDISCEKWHLNRLIALIKIFNFKNQPKSKKKSKSQLIREYKEMNDERLRKYNTTG